MSTPNERDHLDPNNLIYYAPRRMREDANAGSAASTDTTDSVSSPSYVDSLPKQAVGRSYRALDPVAMHEPPTSGTGRWRELIPAVGRLATAIGLATLAALFIVTMIPASKNHAQDGNASSVAEAPKAASNVPETSAEKQAQRPEESAPALAEFGTVLAAGRTAQAAEPDMTSEQSDALLQQFVRWQQKHDSTDALPQ